MVLAICEGVGGSARFWGTVLPPLIVVAWGGLLFLALRRTSLEDRAVLIVVFIAAALMGGAIFFLPEGVSGDGSRTGLSYLDRFLLSVSVAAVLGAIGAKLRPRTGPRMLGAAVLGDVSMPGVVVLLFAWDLSLHGGCIG